MKVKTYVILERAIEEGVARGWNRAHKHVENPTPEHIMAEILQAVMVDICNVFSFDEIEDRS